MNKYFDELIILIRDLSNQHIPDSLNSLDEAMNKVKKLTKLIWNTHNKEIISKLEEFNIMFQKDYQLFWFDCLKYPFSWPEMKGLDGIPIDMRYEYLPSDFNDENFHDSVIRNIIFGSNLEIYIDKIELINMEDSFDNIVRKVKVTFNNISSAEKQEWIQTERKYVKSKFDFKDLIDNDILEFIEVPSINYFIKDLAFENELIVKNKRIFLLNLFLKHWTRIILVSDDWEIEKYENI